MFLFVYFVAFLGTVYAASQIKVQCGHLSVEGYQNCEIKHNNEFVNFTGPDRQVIHKSWFGLINYKCDTHAGYLISTFDCKGCGFYCSHDEFEVGERLVKEQETVQFWAGVISGVLLTSAFGGFLFLYVYRNLNLKILADQYFQWRESNHSETNKSESMKTLVNNDESYANNENESSNERGQGEVNSNVEVSTSEDKKETAVNLTSRLSQISLISVIFFMKSVGGCDLTLHMDSNNFTTLCLGTDCHSPSPSDHFSVSLGQKICFEDHFGSVVTINISEITIRTRYELMYYTSDYKFLSVSSQGECYNIRQGSLGVPTDRSCYSAGSLCHDEKTFLNQNQAQDKSRSLQGSKCESSKNKDCRGSYDSSSTIDCCRYSWHIIRSEDLYPVYFKVGQIWMVKFTANRNNYTQEMEFSTYNPSHDLQGFKLKSSDIIPITVLDAIVNTSLAHNALLQYEGKLVKISASEVHEPSSGLFGDIQVPLKKDKLIYSPPNRPVCNIHGSRSQYYNDHYSCSCECNLPDSKFSTFVHELQSYNTSNDFLIRKEDSSIIDTFDRYAEGSLRVKIGNWRINDSLVKNGKCDIEYVMSDGCTSCNESSYIILRPYNIEKEGIVPLLSNCSFDKPYIKCDRVDPIILTLKENERFCYLKMPTLNKSIPVINIEYLDLNYLSNQLRKVNLSATYGEAFEHLITSERFTGTLIKTILFCSIFGLISTIICRAIKEFNQSRREGASETGLVQL